MSFLLLLRHAVSGFGHHWCVSLFGSEVNASSFFVFTIVIIVLFTALEVISFATREVVSSTTRECFTAMKVVSFAVFNKVSLILPHLIMLIVVSHSKLVSFSANFLTHLHSLTAC